MADNNKSNLVESLMKDVVGENINVEKDAIVDTISNILHEYNLNTDMSFVEKMAALKFPGTTDGHIDMDELLQNCYRGTFYQKKGVLLTP